MIGRDHNDHCSGRRRSPLVIVGVLVSLFACTRPVTPTQHIEPAHAGVAPTAAPNEPTGPGVWTDVAPPLVPGEVVPAKAVFADARGIWRCVNSRCEHFGANGEPGAAWELACGVSNRFVAAADGGVVAQICGTDLVVIETRTARRRTQSVATPEVDALVVDPRGSVTLTVRGAGDEVIVLRYPPTGQAPRRTVVANRSTGNVAPATGELLAYTDGNGPREAAWFDGTPPVEVAVAGLSLVNGEHLWVSEMSGGYLRQRARSREPVRGAPKGGMPPCGLLLDSGPWGDEGLLFVYERAVLLVDAQLEGVGVVPLPGGTMTLRDAGTVARASASDVVASPAGDRLYATLPDGAVLRWTGSLHDLLAPCRG